jgi:hypothetical protein
LLLVTIVVLTPETREKFQAKIDKILCDHLPAQLSFRVFRGLNKCEAKNCSDCLEVARAWARILCCHVLRAFAGPSDSFSHKSAD